MNITISVNISVDTSLAGFIDSGVSAGVTVAGSPQRRYVDLMNTPSVSFVDSTTTITRTLSKADGSFRFDHVPLGKKYILIGYDDRANQVYNDVIRAAVQAVPYP